MLEVCAGRPAWARAASVLQAPRGCADVAKLKQWLRIAAAGAAFVGFGLGAVVLAWLVLPPLSVFGPRAARRRRCQRVVFATFVFFHDYMRMCRLVDFDPRRQRAQLPKGPLVIVTNHPTLVDVSALSAAFGALCVVAKRTWFRNPLVGPLFHFCGFIEGGRRDEPGGARLLEECTQRLREGHRVLMFPEGTRSPREGMHRFRNGAFHLALRNKVPVLPVLITAEPDGLKKDQPWYDIPTEAIRLRLHPLPLVAADGFADPLALQAEVRKRLDIARVELRGS
jgi:1-acyl-sn-glycerol-3-phosphate acyltransferase